MPKAFLCSSKLPNKSDNFAKRYYHLPDLPRKQKLAIFSSLEICSHILHVLIYFSFEKKVQCLGVPVHWKRAQGNQTIKFHRYYSPMEKQGRQKCVVSNAPSRENRKIICTFRKMPDQVILQYEHKNVSKINYCVLTSLLGALPNV